MRRQRLQRRQRRQDFRQSFEHTKLSRMESLYRSRKQWYSDFDEDDSDVDSSDDSDIDYSEVDPDEVFHDRESLELDEDFVETLEKYYINSYYKVLNKVIPTIHEWETDLRNLYYSEDLDMYKRGAKIIDKIKSVLSSIKILVEDIEELYERAKTYGSLDYGELVFLSKYLEEIIVEFSELLDLCKQFTKMTYLKLDEEVLQDIENEVHPEVVYLYAKVPDTDDWYLRINIGFVDFIKAG